MQRNGVVQAEIVLTILLIIIKLSLFPRKSFCYGKIQHDTLI